MGVSRRSQRGGKEETVLTSEVTEVNPRAQGNALQQALGSALQSVDEETEAVPAVDERTLPRFATMRVSANGHPQHVQISRSKEARALRRAAINDPSWLRDEPSATSPRSTMTLEPDLESLKRSSLHEGTLSEAFVEQGSSTVRSFDRQQGNSQNAGLNPEAAVFVPSGRPVILPVTASALGLATFIEGNRRLRQDEDADLASEAGCSEASYWTNRWLPSDTF